MNDQPESTRSTLTLVLGTAGLLICSAGTLLKPAPMQGSFFASGSFLMALSAAKSRNSFFTLLSLLATIGAVAGLSPISTTLKTTIPCTFAILFLLLLYRKGEIATLLRAVGALGLFLLALGYAFTHPVIYFSGSFILCLYSIVEFKNGLRLALYWAILNLVFCITSGIAIYRLSK